MEISDEERNCCGSGCTNCVHDLKPANHTLPVGVINLFDRTYRRFVCCSISQQTEHVFRFRLRLDNSPHGRPRDPTVRLIVPPGCHLYLRAPKIRDVAEFSPHHKLQLWGERNRTRPTTDRALVNGLGKYDKNEEDLYLSRPYTPIAYDHEEGTFDVLIKLEPGGRMTEYLLTLAIGSPTEWKGVYGDFGWTRNQYQNVVGFVQGVAIAPVYSTMKAILGDEEDYTRLTLCACFRSLRDVLLRDELLAMADYWNFKYETYLSGPSCSCAQEGLNHCGCFSNQIRYKEPIVDRRLEASDIERLLAPFSGRTNALLVLVCGTDPFTMFIKSSLAKLGIENCYIF